MDSRVAARFIKGGWKSEFMVKVVLDVDDDLTPQDEDPTYFAQQRFLDSLKDRIAKGVRLHDARIVEGLVNDDGVIKN